ncbi:ethanolaminephosphotransferase 1-like protein [Leptotrombidium deliense]|uniref:Ethanolaminephosphotransferase 1-like protein n=1 Tax=Leptotrombidium deliense TaxID=299467 RepID=A0A443SGG8_9ACAR|nr:ethanolaminephosphotransferase 1-like protein [Leptotrombidium deliense]
MVHFESPFSRLTVEVNKYITQINVAHIIIPEWLAPNVLTFTVLNAFLLTLYDYDFCASSDANSNCPPVPSWVWIFCAVSHFLAHTLDGIDGKQARKTKSSGPLGELFDHGLDSWTSLFIPFCIYSLFGRGEYSYEPIRVLFIFWAIFSTFYFSHWEKYNTGILYLPWSYDISQIALFIMYIVTYCQTYTIWNFTLPVLSLSVGQMFEIISHVGSFGISIPVAVYNVYVAYRSNSLKQSTLYECLLPLVSVVVLFSTTTFWAVYSPSDIVNKDPRVFYFMLGTCRLIFRSR